MMLCAISARINHVLMGSPVGRYAVWRPWLIKRTSCSGSW